MTTDSMVERLAKVIAPQQFEGERFGQCGCEDCKKSRVAEREFTRAVARKYLQAMREPTDEMVNAAYKALAKYDMYDPDAWPVRRAHQAMIDEALKP